MSAINPVIQTPPRSNPDQFKPGAGQNTAPTAQQGFSDTLNSVAAKPVRKSFRREQHTQGSGDSLPATGNHSPPATPAPSSSGAGNASAPGNAAATSPAAAGASGVIGSAAVSAGAGQAATAALRAHSARQRHRRSHRRNRGPSRIAPPTAEARPRRGPGRCSSPGSTDAAPAADAAVSNSKGAVAASEAAAIDSSAAKNSLPGQTGQIPPSPAAAAAALASSVQTVSTGAAATSEGWRAGGGQRRCRQRCAGPGGTGGEAGPKARGHDTRELDCGPKCGRNARQPATVAPRPPESRHGCPGPAQCAASRRIAASTAATTPMAPVDTAAMIGAMQANSPAPRHPPRRQIR